MVTLPERRNQTSVQAVDTHIVHTPFHSLFQPPASHTFLEQTSTHSCSVLGQPWAKDIKIKYSKSSNMVVDIIL